MPTSVREQLEALNEECEAFCLRESNWSHTKWSGVGPQGTANFRLLYSSPKAFQRGRLMILGTNPGGDHTNADDLDPWVPFEPDVEYSAYVDDRWPKRRSTDLMEAGTHTIQKAVRRLAASIAEGCLRNDSSSDGDALLHSLPSSNLIPLRSTNFAALPRSLRPTGLQFGWDLIRITQPRALILLSSSCELWDALISEFAQGASIWVKDLRPGANRPLREAVLESPTARPQFIWALPAFNTGMAGPKPIERLLERMHEHRIRVKTSGQVTVSRR